METPESPRPVDAPPRSRRDIFMSDTWRWPVAVALSLVVGFLGGFLPQWQRARALEGDLGRASYDLEVTRLQGLLGAALAEAQRSNYERARQLTSSFYVGLEGLVPRVGEPRRRQTLSGIQAERDEIITLLSRAAPEAIERLALLYTHYFEAMDPFAGQAPSAVTPSPGRPEG